MGLELPVLSAWYRQNLRFRLYWMTFQIVSSSRHFGEQGLFGELSANANLSRHQLLLRLNWLLRVQPFLAPCRDPLAIRFLTRACCHIHTPVMMITGTKMICTSS